VNRKESILDAATRLFARKGFEATTTAAVAEAAGVSEGTIFHHFKTKDGVLIHILQELTILYCKELQAEASEADSGMDAIERMMRFHFRFILKHSLKSLVIFRDIPSHFLKLDSPHRQFVIDHASMVVRLFSENIERGRSDGSIKEVPALKTALLLRGLLVGLTRQKLFGPHEVPDLSREAIEFCRRSLVPDAR
jgi:AcrR family transcriptional regulator